MKNFDLLVKKNKNCLNKGQKTWPNSKILTFFLRNTNFFTFN